MPLLPLAAAAALALWIVFTFVLPVGPAGTVVHLLLGLSAALFVRWWALRPDNNNRS